MSCFLQISHNFFISSFVKVYPVGLLGELTAITFVFGFINASSSSKSTTHFVPSSFIYHLEYSQFGTELATSKADW